MPQTFKVDQAATFSHVVLLGCEPKVGFGGTEQDRTKDGTPKWELQLVAAFRQFDRTTNEVLKVGVVSERSPAEGIAQFSPLRLRNFEVGVMDKRGRDGELLGAQVWYRCEAIESLAAVPGSRKLDNASTAG